MAARLQASRTGVRPVTATAAARQAGLAWPRLPAVAESATIGAGYAAYSLIRLAIRAGHRVAFTHAAELWHAERRLHLTVEPYLNHLAAAHTLLAEAAGYYYGLLHFLVTPLVLAWLYLRRPAAFPRLRSGLVLATAAANAVFWAWPAAPPRFSVPGMTDILVAHDILGAAHPRGATSLVNLYAAMPSLHVAWAAWCAAAVVTTTRGRWRHLAWLYPAATTLVVLVSANHFLLDVTGGLAVAGLGMLATSRPSQLLAPRALPATARDGRRAKDGHRRAIGRGQHRALHDGWVLGRFLRAGAAADIGHHTAGTVMTCGVRPGTTAAAAGHPDSARPGDIAAGRVPELTGGRVRAAFRRGRPWVWVLAAGVVAAAVVRAPGAASDVRAAAGHLGGPRAWWLGVAVAAEIVSLAGGAGAQRQLLAAAGAYLPWRTVFRPGACLHRAGQGDRPAGPVTGGAWQVREYRRRGAGTAPGVWAVLAGGFTSIAVISALLLAGAAVAGRRTPVARLLGRGAGRRRGRAPRRGRRGGAPSRWLSRRHHRSPAIARLAAAMAGVSRQPPGFRLGVGVLACTCTGLLADAGVLAACFGLAGLPVPWRGLLFAYAAGQLAGQLVPLPGGLGGVEGGVLGALTLTGTPPAAAAAAVIVYRVTGCWTVGATGAAAAAALARRPPARAAAPPNDRGTVSSPTPAATADSTPKPAFE